MANLRKSFEMHILFVRGGISRDFDHFITDASGKYIMSDIQAEWEKWKHYFTKNRRKA